MKFSGIFNGGIIRNKIPNGGRDIQTGPNVSPKPSDPVETLLSKSIGKIPYEATGYVQPRKVEYLKS